MNIKINSKVGVSSGKSKKPIGRRERRSEKTRTIYSFLPRFGYFGERGFNATTIEAITEAADVGKGTFFYYFENKESLLLEHHQIQMGKVRAFLAKCMTSKVSLSTLLFGHAMNMAAEERKRPALLQSLIMAIFSNETIQNSMLAGLNPSIQTLEELIAYRQQCGEIRSDIAPNAVAHAFQRMLFGTMAIWTLSPDTPLEENLKNMIDIFIHGIQAGSK